MKKIDYFSITDGIELRSDEAGKVTVSLHNVPVSLSKEEEDVVSFLVRCPEAAVEDIMDSWAASHRSSPSEGAIRTMLAKMADKSLIIKETKDQRIRVPYRLDHDCKMCGCSCHAQLVGPLSETELANVIDAHADLHNQKKVPQNVNPIMKGLRQDGSCLHFLNFPGKRCIFLNDDNLCTIHAQFGAMKKPAACRRFPLIAISAGPEIRVAVKPYCYNNFASCRLEVPDDGYFDGLLTGNDADAYRDLIDSAAERPVLRNVPPTDIAQARLQEIQILSWLQDPRMTIPKFILNLFSEQAASAKSLPAQKLPDAFTRELESRFRRFADMLIPEAEKLGNTAHALHVRALCTQLKKPLSVAADNEGNAFTKFTLYSLHNAVFLRETSRFPSVALGTFALALGYFVAIQAPQNPDELLIAWMRIFAQTPAFTLLFDSPMSLSALIGKLSA